MCDKLASTATLNMATCYSSYELHQQPTSRTPQLQKDYSRPLHVDCSVEYELPNQAKPPVGVRNEPLLMIHPCYFRKIESQRRSPFVNNLPNRQQQIIAKRRIHQQQQQQQHRHQVAAVATAQQHQQPQQQATHHHHHHQHHQHHPVQALPPQAQQQQQQLPQLQPPAVAQQAPGHQQPHQVPQPQTAAPYPVQFTAATNRQEQQLWEPLPPLIPIAGQTYVNPGVGKRDPMLTAAYSSSTGSTDSGHWTDSDKSPEKTEEKHILSGKYRQYLRAHRLHPYVTSSIPLASTFPQIQQVCYNV